MAARSMEARKTGQQDGVPGGVLRVEPYSAPAFVELMAQAIEAGGPRKGERTRRRVLWATAVELAEASFADLNMDRIARRADVSRAALYQYVGSKEEAVRLVLTDFQSRTLDIPARAMRGGTILETIERTNRYYIDYFARNAVFMERVRELRSVMPELIAEKQRVNRRWAERVIAHVEAHRTEAMPEARLRLRVLALECMIDDVLREIFVINNPDFLGCRENLDLLARELSEIWHGALYRE
ncbi:MAG: TetR-family transcriptional [Beijerinckiaceae bacterium]|nr:MAG: TetR-family transcriptional [Beijerinckiaceae bacterium]